MIFLVLSARRVALEYEIKDQPYAHPLPIPAVLPPIDQLWINRYMDIVKPDCAIEIPEQECG